MGFSAPRAFDLDNGRTAILSLYIGDASRIGLFTRHRVRCRVYDQRWQIIRGATFGLFVILEFSLG